MKLPYFVIRSLLYRCGSTVIVHTKADTNLGSEHFWYMADGHAEFIKQYYNGIRDEHIFGSPVYFDDDGGWSSAHRFQIDVPTAAKIHKEINK